MRVYFEKPRTTTGWKGLINDPHLDGSGDVNAGLRRGPARAARRARRAGCRSAASSSTRSRRSTSPTPSAGAAIGARTTESQIHRQLGSGLSMPVGFKNRTDGNVQVAVDAVRAAAVPHAFAGIAEDGTPAIHAHPRQPGLPHHPARRQRTRPNYGAEAFAEAMSLLRAAGLPERAMIDVSPRQLRQGPVPPAGVAEDVGRQIADGNRAIVGAMVESFLVGGQPGARRGRAGLRPVDHRRLPRLGGDGRVLDGLAAAVRARRARAAKCGSRSSASA